MTVLHRMRHRLAGSIEGLGDTVQYARHLLKGHRFSGALTRVDPTSAPVVLIHGFLGTRGTMEPLSRRLQQDGRAVFSYAHGNLNLASIESSANELLAQIRGICRDLGVSRVDIVGYSMGGLLGLYALKFLGGDRHIRSLTMLGSPLRGSWLGLVGVATLGVVSAAAWQLLPGS